MTIVNRRIFLGAASGAAITGPDVVQAATRAGATLPAPASAYGDLIGRTPLYALTRLAPRGTRVVAKLELLNPMSVKDRPAFSMLTAASAAGRLKPGRSPISIATGRRGFLEENLSGSPKTEACAGAIVE